MSDDGQVFGRAQYDNRFSKHLIHRPEKVGVQAKAGLYLVNRVYKFIDKWAEASGKYSKSLLEISGHEGKKRENIKDDGMQQTVGAFVQIQDLLEEFGNAHGEFSKVTGAQVTKPLKTFLKSGERKMADIVKRDQRCISAHQKVVKAVTSKQQEALKQWTSLQKAKTELKRASELRAAPKGEKSFQKAEDGYRKSVQKTARAFADVENGLPTWNSQAEQISRHDRAEVLSAYEHLEVERLGAVYNSLSQAVVTLESLLTPLRTALDDFKVIMDNIDDDEQMEKYVDNLLDEEPTPASFEVFKHGLPCASETIVANGEKLRNLLDEDVHTSIAKYELEQNASSSNSSTSNRLNASQQRSPSSSIRRTRNRGGNNSRSERKEPQRTEEPQQPSTTAAEDPFGFEDDDDTSNPFDSPAAVATANTTIAPSSAPAPQQQNTAARAQSKDEGAEEAEDEYAQALFDFQTDDADDLSLKEGDVVCVLSKDGQWWRGCKVVDGEWSDEGSFPAAYVGPYKP